MCKDFLEQEVYPNLDRIDAQEEGLMQSILRQSRRNSDCSAFQYPNNTADSEKILQQECSRPNGSAPDIHFPFPIAAHTGIGTLPILYYGNNAQKEKYISKLATGEWKAAYCLTEPGSGSDANSGKTKAVLSADGKSYIINGQKMWITNAGFADIFIVFAKIDNDENLSAFIVEKNFPGHYAQSRRT